MRNRSTTTTRGTSSQTWRNNTPPNKSRMQPQKVTQTVTISIPLWVILGVVGMIIAVVVWA